MTINNSMNNSSYITNYQNNIDKTLGMIASGVQNRIDDSASASIASMLNSEVSAMGQGLMNLNEGIAMMQIADGVTSFLGESVAELSAMSVRYNSASMGTQERAALQSEFDALASSMQDAINSASYNGNPLFGSDNALETSQGLMSAAVGEISTEGLDISSVESIVSFQNTLSSLQSSIGSNTNAMSSAITSLQEAFLNTSAAQSQLQDVDIAEMINNLQQNDMKLQTSTLAQMHETSVLQQQMAKLLGV